MATKSPNPPRIEYEADSFSGAHVLQTREIKTSYRVANTVDPVFVCCTATVSRSVK